MPAQGTSMSTPAVAGAASLLVQAMGGGNKWNWTSDFKSKLVKTEIDTARLLSDKSIKSPTGALLRSAVLPGLGQVYNQKYIKGIFVFAVNGTLGYKIYDYNKKWNDTGESKFRDKRNLFTWYFGLSYLLTLVDAYIDAYSRTSRFLFA